jgi:23S rRNA G2445 N2-methylase RlmL
MSTELERCWNEPGYTPPVRALRGILGSLGTLSDEQARAAERALARAGSPAGSAALDLLAGAPPAVRQRLLAVVRRVAGGANAEALQAGLLAALEDPDPRCRRLAVRALGALGCGDAEPPLVAALNREALPEQRAIVDALGKIGGGAAIAALERLEVADADLARRTARARLLVERRLLRATEHAIELARPLGREARVAALCRKGLAALLADELSAFGARAVSDTRVELVHAGSLQELLVARTALEFGLVVPQDAGIPDPADRIASALVHPDTLAKLAAWTRGTPRFRLEWTQGGHQRATTWRIAEKIREHAHALINDPRHAAWTVRASALGRELLLVPRLAPDPRFDHHVREVPGASHPTIAAALARIAGADPADVVWDPFVGNGLELIERALLGPYQRLIGSDVDARALAASARNFAAARLERCELRLCDARTLRPEGVRVILTNPPMGRRVIRDGTVGDLLEAFVAHAGRVLPRSGRVVWLSPAERRTARAARAAGFRVTPGPDVDMGGFSARVQILTRR